MGRSPPVARDTHVRDARRGSRGPLIRVSRHGFGGLRCRTIPGRCHLDPGLAAGAPSSNRSASCSRSTINVPFVAR